MENGLPHRVAADKKLWGAFYAGELMRSVVLNLAGQVLFGLSLLLCIPPVMSDKAAALPPSGMEAWAALALFILSKACIKLAGNEKGWSLALQAGTFAVFVVALHYRLSLGI